MSRTISVAPGLDPEIDAFIKAMAEGWAQHPPLDTLDFPEQRAVAEAVRAPFARSGPAMAMVSEHQVAVGDGSARIRVLNPSKGGEPKPALVYLHGGGWTIFSIDTHDRLMREYAARAGIMVVAVDYSLAPESPYPRALNETVAVVRWLRANAATLAIDAARVAIGGDSAGANLALSAAIVLRDAGDAGAIAAMLLNYGAFDTRSDRDSYRRFGGPGYMLGGQEMVDFWKNYLGERFDTPDPLAVPLRADLAGLPPALLVVPECDVLFDENMAMDARLRAAGVDTETRIYAGASHSFLEAVASSRLAEQAFCDTAEWLGRKLGAEA